MNYKGYEIADKMNVTECGVETYIRVEDCDVTAETFREYLENCDNRLVKMENDGFKVKGYHISVSVEEPVYNEDYEAEWKIIGYLFDMIYSFLVMK